MTMEDALALDIYVEAILGKQALGLTILDVRELT